jgi:hypothetical protein
VTIYILIITLVILVPLVIGLAYFIRHSSEKRKGVRGREPKKIDPVTLDRNPEMPHRPGATS